MKTRAASLALVAPAVPDTRLIEILQRGAAVDAMRFAKINVRVKNLEAAFAYARDVLKAEVLREQSNTTFGDMFLVRVGGLIIEVLAPDRPDSSLAQIIERRGEGIDSIGFYVDDINATAARMEANGVRFASKDERLAWVHPKNPLSLSIELLNSALVQLDPKTGS